MDKEKDILLKIEDLQVAVRAKKEMLYPVNTVTMEIPARTIVGLVGESGCGKSMTAMSILGLFAPRTQISGGKIWYRERDLSACTPKELRAISGDRISIIFQEPMTSLNPVVRVGKQVEEVLLLHTKLDAAQRKQKVLEMFRKVGIPDPAGRYLAYPYQLSGGLRQRIMIAMAMICDPELLIADEPTTALDVTIEAQILQLMKQLQQDLNTSILMITHNLGVVSRICDEVNVMYLGEIVEHAGKKELFEQPLHPYTRGLMACVPRAEKEKRELENIPGMVPDLRSVPQGCRFCPRCSLATQRCREEKPELYEYAPGHQVRCFCYDPKRKGERE